MSRRNVSQPSLIDALVDDLGLQDQITAELNRQLDGRGTLVDATITSAAVAKPDYEKGQVSEREPDAASATSIARPISVTRPILPATESGLIRQAGR